MELLRKNVFMIIAVIFMLVGLLQSVRGDGGSATWLALGAVFIAIGAVKSSKNKDGNDAG